MVNDEDAEYTVFLNDGSEHSAKVLASDPLNDIAILKIDAKDLPYLNFGDSDKLMPGQTAIAIGNPLLEFENSVSVGVVSGLGRSVVAGDRFGGFSEQLEGVIQTDAAINPGNSGGPLLNLNGEVIGVNVAVASAENIAFSIPANLVKQIFDSVKEHGKIVRAFLGIRYVQINEKMKEANNLSVDYGVLVSKGEKPEDLAVIPGSPADKAGLVENDIILEIDGKKLDGETSMARIISEKKVGDSIKLKMLSRGKEKTVTVRLEEMKNE
ncbi:trypsin-like peptidase domain-containing protein [Candidatus Peregrinibacteria bacterium]|nr:trypsin-like peptidase domain-containing protein [Candidatus Peregrinibacteria bacterium]